MIWTTAFWKGASERAIKTFAQTLAAYFVIGTTGLLDVDWVTALSVSGAATLASVLTSIGNADFTAGEPVVVTEVVGDPFDDVEYDPQAFDEELLLDDTEGGARLD